MHTPAHVPVNVIPPRVPDDAIMLVVSLLGHKAIGIGARVAVGTVHRQYTPSVRMG
jgi:hypothetical protein